MLKKLAWKMFEKTGDIGIYMLLKDIEKESVVVNDGFMAREEVAISTNH